MPLEIEPNLRPPFSGAVDRLVQLAIEHGRPDTPDLTTRARTILRYAQEAADERGKGPPPQLLEDLAIMRVAEVLLSYLGKVPPPALSKELNQRWDRLRGHFERGADPNSENPEDRAAAQDLIDMALAVGDVELTAGDIIVRCRAWTAAMFDLVVESFPPGTVPGGPQ